MSKSLIPKLEAIKQRYNEVADLIIQPDVITDQKKYSQLNKEYSDLGKIVKVYNQYKGALDTISESDEIIADGSDKDFVDLAKAEKMEAQEKIPALEEELKVLLIPKDPTDDKNVIVELRAGTGGDEAAIFVEDIYRMYSMYFKTKGWRHEITDSNEAAKGYKELIMKVEGEGVYGIMKFESGVHRVQRVPETESGGRIHTSAATVAVLPEAEDVDVEIRNEDIRIDTMRASGAGGQHVNTTDSAVRITHLPTGIMVVSAEKSQHQNRARAMQILRARLYDMEREKAAGDRAESRRLQVGSGDRSERIRTYNFPQGRVSDHRINLTLYKLDQVMEGDLGDIVDALISDHQSKLLAEAGQDG